MLQKPASPTEQAPATETHPPESFHRHAMQSAENIRHYLRCLKNPHRPALCTRKALVHVHQSREMREDMLSTRRWNIAICRRTRPLNASLTSWTGQISEPGKRSDCSPGACTTMSRHRTTMCTEDNVIFRYKAKRQGLRSTQHGKRCSTLSLYGFMLAKHGFKAGGFGAVLSH